MTPTQPIHDRITQIIDTNLSDKNIEALAEKWGFKNKSLTSEAFCKLRNDLFKDTTTKIGNFLKTEEAEKLYPHAIEWITPAAAYGFDIKEVMDKALENLGYKVEEGSNPTLLKRYCTLL